MKRFNLLVFIILAPFLFYAQNVKDLSFSADINSAKIYLNNAELTRTKSVRLSAGQNKLIFTGLSPLVDDKSVRISIDNNTVDILMISTSTNYLVDDNKKPAISKLQDSIVLITAKLQNYSDLLDAYKIERDLLLTNKSIGGQDNGVSIQELKETADYYRVRILDINTKVSDINRKVSDLQKDKNRIQSQLNVLNAQSSYIRKEVTVLLETDVALTTNIELKYLVNNAGWSPVYDIKAISTDEPITLIYRAKVFNNTAIDWSNIDITLSTNDANLDNAKPQLTPWYIQASSPIISTGSSGRYYNKASATPQVYQQSNVANLDDNFGYDNADGVGGVGDNSTMVYDAAVPVLSYEFEIDKKYSIPADDMPYLVDISEEQLPATYKHFAVSKLDPGVFLIARIVGWESLNLIDGPANIFYAGSYIGKSFISTGTVKDTLDVSLGRDSKVIVNMKKLNNYSSTQFIGNKKTTTFAYQFEIKNNHQSPITLEISDQIPISQSDDVEVKMIEVSGGDVNITTGEVVWLLQLAPGETKKIEFTFSVKYPKNTSIPLNQNSRQQVRYFY
ncbi:MAG: mucoidy inhibitor MuiA family protein [Bacteroidales bacterium]|nr:mucoidy inhibitor MuiA family protein [Bacteroidales bacterium]